ncbi:MAG: L-rhamnose mutarotase [Bacteroidetes bacterium]|nr:MAG: L-rhamnose mutarotase [Bacteroidota bacterium]
MKSYARTLDLRDDPEAIARYIAYHAAPWPEVTAALRAVGVIEMKIWLRGRRLFMYFCAADDFDPARDLPRYLDLHPRCREWEDLMTTLQEPLPGTAPGEKWVEMEQIFEL